MSDLIDTYPDTLVVVEYHLWDDYDTPWGDARAVFYDPAFGTTTPHLILDGVVDGGADPALFKYWYQIRETVPTDVTVEAEVFLGGASCQVVATVCVEPAGNPRAMRLYVAQVLDHFPSVPDYSRNTFRRAAATQDVFVDSGSCVEVVRALTLDAISASQPEQVRIVTWVQQPLASAPAEIEQAVVADWPFPGVFRDGFESGDGSAWSSTEPW